MSLTIERTTEIAQGLRELNARFGTYCVANDDGLWRVYRVPARGERGQLVGNITEPEETETPERFAQRLEVQLGIWGVTPKGAK